MSFKAGLFQKLLSLILGAGFALGLCGCALTFYHYPATAQTFDPEASFAALKPDEVYFFISKEAFPPGLQSVPVGYLFSPLNTNWSYQDIIQEFQKKAAEIGANAVVFEKLNVEGGGIGYGVYKGRATAYRLFKQNPSEDVDLSSTQYGTQNPDLTFVK